MVTYLAALYEVIRTDRFQRGRTDGQTAGLTLSIMLQLRKAQSLVLSANVSGLSSSYK